MISESASLPIASYVFLRGRTISPFSALPTCDPQTKSLFPTFHPASTTFFFFVVFRTCFWTSCRFVHCLTSLLELGPRQIGPRPMLLFSVDDIPPPRIPFPGHPPGRPLQSQLQNCEQPYPFSPLVPAPFISSFYFIIKLRCLF